MKKPIAVLIIVGMLFSGLPAFALFTDVASIDGEYAVNMLSDLGIIAQEEEQYRPYANISRAEFARMLALSTGFSEELAGGGSQVFSDVPFQHEHYPYIEFLFMRGMVNGYADGTFRPEDTISYVNAAKLVVDALGYGFFAREKGGYPAGYLVMASELRLGRNLPVQGQTVLTKVHAAVLISNALEVDIAAKTKYGEYDRVEITRGVTLANKYLDLQSIRGIVTANSDTALADSAGVALNHVKIATEIYDAAQTNAKEYLGYSVRAYYREDLAGTYRQLVSIRPDPASNLATRLRAERITEVEKSQNRYTIVYQQENKTEQIPLYTDQIDVIYNGRAYNGFTDETFFLSSGGMILLDNNNDGVYDVVFITEYQTYIARSVNSSTEVIYAKYGQSIQAESLPGRKVVIQSDQGAPVRLTDIPEGAVLAVAESKNHAYMEITVSTRSISGEITAVFDNGSYLTIDHLRYAVSKHFRDLRHPEKIEPAVGVGATFLLDMDGNIADVQRRVFKGWSYGYLLEAKVNGVISSDLQLKLLTENSKVVVFDCQSKLVLDSRSQSLTEMLDRERLLMRGGTGVKAVRQLIKYALSDDGSIRAIDTAYRDPDETDENLTKSLSGAGGTFNQNSKSFYAGAEVNFVVNPSETLVFSIPNDPVLTRDDAYYYTYKAAYSNEQSFGNEFDVFDMDPAKVAKVLVRNANDRFGIQRTSETVLVEKISTAINEDGEIVQILMGLGSGGQAYEKRTGGPEVISGVKKGDVVRVRERGGLLSAVVKEADAQTVPRPESLYLKSEGGNISTHNAELNIVFGYIADTYKTFVNVSSESPIGERFTPYDLAGKKILAYDSGKDAIYTVSQQELFSYTLQNNPNAKIYIAMNYGGIKAVVVFH